MVKCCSDHSCKYNHNTGYYGICKHPSMENAVGYGGIDRMLVENCGNKETVHALKDYQGCRNCKYQPEPMQTCDWLREQTEVHMICPRWERK